MSNLLPYFSFIFKPILIIKKQTAIKIAMIIKGSNQFSIPTIIVLTSFEPTIVNDCVSTSHKRLLNKNTSAIAHKTIPITLPIINAFDFLFFTIYTPFFILFV